MRREYSEGVKRIMGFNVEEKEEEHLKRSVWIRLNLL